MTKETVVVTAASIHPDAVEMLKDFNVVYADVRAGEDALAELCRVQQPSAIMVRYGNISAKVIESSQKLRVISKHGVGIDNIDKAAATQRQIPVIAAMGSNSQAVAEHTIGLILACARKTAWLDARMREGHWDKEGYLGIELAGLTLGLIGAGSIGARVAAVGIALGMEVIVSDPFAKPGSLPQGVRMVDLDAVVSRANVISLHCPLTPETRNVLNAKRIRQMKDNTIVVNTARAGLIDEDALLSALEVGRLHAGIDCFEDEPLRQGSPWLSAPNSVITPHIGGTSSAAFREMGVRAAEAIVKSLASV